MNAIDYVIVGAEVDEARRFLLPGGDVSSEDAPGARPLTVEFIGEEIVRLSKSGAVGLTPAVLAQIKDALRVRELGGPGSPLLTDAERQAILDDTSVSISFEARVEAADQPDRNTRMLVVPSDRTLEIAVAALQAACETGFRPPLTYELDRTLMLASLSATILEIVAGFGLKAVPGWTPELQGALTAHVETEIRDRTTFVDNAGEPADSVLNEIMRSPIRAFHRSVGIYATNMCR